MEKCGQHDSVMATCQGSVAFENWQCWAAHVGVGQPRAKQKVQLQLLWWWRTKLKSPQMPQPFQAAAPSC